VSPGIIIANVMVRLRSLSRERSAMFFTVAFPVILVLVFGAIFTTAERLNFELPVQDRDASVASDALVRGLGSAGVFRVRAVPLEADAAQFAKDNKLTLILVIPRGFEAAQRRRIQEPGGGDPLALTCVYDPSSTSVATKMQYLSAAISEFNEKLSGAPRLLTLTTRSILDRPYRFIEFFVPGIIAMAVMTSCLSGALNTNAELRQKGILRKLSTTPITRIDWLLSNMLYQIILAAASTTAILLVAYTAFDVRLHIDVWLPVYVVLAVFTFVGIGMLLTPFAKEAESASAVGNAVLFPMMFLSGTFFPVEMMPGFLQVVARGLPLYYVNEGLRASMVFVDDIGSLRCAAITSGVAAVVFVAGAFVTRWDRDP